MPGGQVLYKPPARRRSRRGTCCSNPTSTTLSPLTRRRSPRAHISLTGLIDRVSVGVIPIVAYSSSIGFEDLTAQAQYRLTQFHVGGWVPMMFMSIQETFPTGKYDRLGDRTSDGFGAGAYTTTLALYSQTYFWMPNGRIVRARMDVQQTVWSTRVPIADASVYGTSTGFRGDAVPGASTFIDLSGEYSLTRNWVLALDANYGMERRYARGRRRQR